MSQEDYYEPNEEEKKLIRENSVFAGKAIDCAYRAGAVSTLLFAKMGNGDQSDAIRHCIWSALIAKETNAEWSKKWTDAHESVEPNPRIHMDMDIHNNLVGIKIVQKNPAVTYGEIINNCIQQMKLGQLVVTDGSKLIPSTIKGFNLPNAFEVIKQRIRELFDYLIDFYRAEQAQTNGDGKNLAHACVNSNFVYGLNRACSIFPQMVDQADKYGCPPIFDAINQRVDECFTALIGFGANVNFQNPLSGDTPLMEAAVYNELNFVQILLATGADNSLRNFSGSTALDFALAEGNDEIVQLLR